MDRNVRRQTAYSVGKTPFSVQRRFFSVIEIPPKIGEKHDMRPTLRRMRAEIIKEHLFPSNQGNFRLFKRYNFSAEHTQGVFNE